MKITTIFNNEARKGLKPGWGFSCLVENKEAVLFDTGCDGPDLLFNMDKLGVDIHKIKKTVISHEHWDHTGGLMDLLDKNSGMEVFVLESFSAELKGMIKKTGAKVVEVSDSQEISEDIMTTGILDDSPDEQSLIIKTSKGLVVIAGCSHPGVERIIEKAKEHGKVHAIIGGFHGFSDLDALEGIDVIGACHCTQHIKEIRQKYPENFKEIKAGDVIEIK